MSRFALAVAVAIVPASVSLGRDYFVAPDGKDMNSGDKHAPFRTLGAAASVVKPGETCFVRGGVYRETVAVTRSGAKGKPIRFEVFPGEIVTLSGTQRLTGAWTKHKGSIYKTKVARKFIQLFADGKLMFEARWPNVTPAEMLTRKAWAQTGKGSRYGKVVDANLAATKVDWTGAVAVLNVAHQFYTWSRTVQTHAAGSDTFTYAKDLAGITSYADKTRQWEDDRYFLVGKLAALDSPGEWFHDRETGTLYFWPPEGKDPSNVTVEIKVRDLAFDVRGADHVEIAGFHFFATTFRFDGCDHCVVDGCHLRYPVYARRLEDKEARDELGILTTVTGQHNVVRNTSLAHSPTGGLTVRGRHNAVDNCLIRDTCWFGSLKHLPLMHYSTAKQGEKAGCVTRYCTVFDGGNALIGYRGWGGHVVEYNHAYNGGLSCKDVALVYTGQPSIAGSIVRYNWVHGCRTDHLHGGKLHGGLGIRGDDQTRSLTVHHNVVWDCGRDGIIVKGDHNRVFNNTVFDIGGENATGNYISLHRAAEPKKWWRKQHPLLKVQNANSTIFNNAAVTITGNQRGEPFPRSENVAGNCPQKDLKLVAPDKLDFLPRADSPLVDAGRKIEGFTDDFAGKAPDIGAYEHGRDRWIPGHRNAVCLTRDGAALKVAMLMPLLAPLEVTVGDRTLTFRPDNWMKPQPVGLSGSDVRISIPSLHVAKTVSPDKIDPDRGVSVPFVPIP
jgi:hypothetical protein